MDLNTSTIAVTGATGFVGRAVIRELLARGCSVRALCRDRDKARTILPASPKVTPILGSVLDGRSTAELLRGCHACIHLIGIIRETSSTQTFKRMHVEATREVVETAQSLGVKRLIHMSALGVSPDGRAEYQRSKYEAETLVRRSTLDWTIFRPGLIHGQDGELVNMIRSWCTGESQPWFLIPSFVRVRKEYTDAVLPTMHAESAAVAPVSVEDVARAFAESLARRATIGEAYNLVGGQSMTFKQMLSWWRDHLPRADQSLPILGVPAEAASLQAKAAKMIGLGAFLPFDEGMPLMASEDSTADLSKVRAHLGLEPEGFETSASRYVGAMA